MFLSVIIPTRNRATLLERGLEALCGQTLSPQEFEVIVVDNGSTDGTAQVCAAYAERLDGFHYLHEAEPGLHAGRHAGLKAARGEILVYADDDSRAFPGWLESIREAFDDPSVALVGGRNLPEFEESPPDWVEWLWEPRDGRRQCEVFSILDYGERPMEIRPESVWGCNFSIRRDVLLEVGGFHPDGMPADLLARRGDGETAVSREIVRRGYRSLYHPGASVFHWVSAERMTYAYVHRRGFLSGISHSYAVIRARGGLRTADRVMMAGQHVARVIWHGLHSTRPERAKYYLARDRGFSAGVRFHRRAVRHDPELLQWVLKEDYL